MGFCSIPRAIIGRQQAYHLAKLGHIFLRDAQTNPSRAGGERLSQADSTPTSGASTRISEIMIRGHRSAKDPYFGALSSLQPPPRIDGPATREDPNRIPTVASHQLLSRNNSQCVREFGIHSPGHKVAVSQVDGSERGLGRSRVFALLPRFRAFRAVPGV